MFNRKKIKALKENLKEVNDQRLQLRNENIIYQKELNALKEMVKSFEQAIRNNNFLIENTLKDMSKAKTTTKKTTKVKKEEKNER